MPQKSVMLAPNRQLAVDDPAIPYPMMASRKLDGIRLLIKGGKLLSRSLKPQPNIQLKAMLLPLLEYCASEDLVLDGEVYSHEHAFSDHGSLMRSHDKPFPLPFSFWPFDAMREYEWERSSAGTFIERLDLVDYICDEGFPRVGKINQMLVRCSSSAAMLYDAWLAEGYEGMMLKSPSSLYKHGRATVNEGTFFKFKQWTKERATIIGFIERRQMVEGASGSRGETPTGHLERVHRQDAFEGAEEIGSVILMSDAWGSLEFNATFARGHKPDTLGLTWENREEFLGKTVTFVYQRQGSKDVPRIAKITEIH